VIRAVKLAWLVAGGAIGTVARFWLSRVVHESAGPHFPYGTLAVNATGCLFIGLLATMGQGKVSATPEMRLFFMVGFCGAFTTFSSLILESDHLFKSGQALHAFANVFISLIAGFAAFAVGSWLGSKV
jgi:CrcB protein